jgi:hypothetical protein
MGSISTPVHVILPICRSYLNICVPNNFLMKILGFIFSEALTCQKPSEASHSDPFFTFLCVTVFEWSD